MSVDVACIMEISRHVVCENTVKRFSCYDRTRWSVKRLAKIVAGECVGAFSLV
jgi:hypothetical protein